MYREWIRFCGCYFYRPKKHTSQVKIIFAPLIKHIYFFKREVYYQGRIDATLKEHWCCLPILLVMLLMRTDNIKHLFSHLRGGGVTLWLDLSYRTNCMRVREECMFTAACAQLKTVKELHSSTYKCSYYLIFCTDLSTMISFLHNSVFLFLAVVTHALQSQS